MKTLRPLPEKRTCVRCKKEKPISEFGKTASKYSPRGFYFRSYCIACNKKMCREYSTHNRPKRNERLRNWRRKNPEAAHNNDLKKRLKNLYGITKEQVEQMRSDQEGKCFLCGRIPPRLVIDHDHKTGKVRSLLCNRCNSLVGWIEIYVALDKIESYLRK